MLTIEQWTTFEERGYVRVSSAFSKPEAQAMEDHLWTVLQHRSGARQDDPMTWPADPPSGLRTMRRTPVFQAIGSAATVQALDDLLGVTDWKRPNHWGQFLVTFPTAENNWTVPNGWHNDFGYLYSDDRLFGALVFSFLADVSSRAGGTAILAGSHRLIGQFVKTQPKEALKKMKRARMAIYNIDPWLKALASEEDTPDRVERFMEREQIISGIPMRVEELTGSAGDVVICHPWLLHSISPNCGHYPRFMCIQRVYKSEE